MRIDILDQAQATSTVKCSLQLPLELELDSDEGLAALLRRVGALRTPCRASKILGEVTSLLEPLLDLPLNPERIENLLDSLVSYGDFAAVTRSVSGTTELLYRVQPSYLIRTSGDALLIGLDQPGQQGLPTTIQQQVRLRGHARVLPMGGGVIEALKSSGFLELSVNQWLDIPHIRTSSEILSEALRDLRLSPRETDVPGLTLIDPLQPVRYYAGRKRAVRDSDVGFFVARRPREYGADAWCFVEIDHGQVVHLMDLPGQGKTRGCDQAWLLQGAIDRERGSPQLLGVSRGASQGACLSVFSPIPGWLQRRWETMSVPTRMKGALLSFAFETDHVEDEIEFARASFFLETVEED